MKTLIKWLCEPVDIRVGAGWALVAISVTMGLVSLCGFCYWAVNVAPRL